MKTMVQVAGMDYLREPKLFKGMAFTLDERQKLGIHGLLPPRYTFQLFQLKSIEEGFIQKRMQRSSLLGPTPAEFIQVLLASYFAQRGF